LAGFQGQTKEAYEIVARMHAGGDRTSPLVEFEMEEMIRSIQLERELKASTGWRDIISTEDNRKRLFISTTIGVFAQWNGVGLVSYCLSPILKSVGVTNVAHITIINGSCRSGSSPLLSALRWWLTKWGGELSSLLHQLACYVPTLS
jgi:hypothetical protein